MPGCLASLDLSGSGVVHIARGSLGAVTSLTNLNLHACQVSGLGGAQPQCLGWLFLPTLFRKCRVIGLHNMIIRAGCCFLIARFRLPAWLGPLETTLYMTAASSTCSAACGT